MVERILKNHKCENTECENISAKDKYRNYKRYCSSECKKSGTNTKFKNTYANKDIEAITAKRKASNIVKYGVSNVAQIDFVRDKLRITTTATVDIRTAKTIETNLSNHGVASTNSIQSVKDKKKESFMEKYGVDHQLKIPEVAASVARKNKANSVERLGKAKITNIEKYGCENPSSNMDVKQKRIDTMLERFGVENASQNAEIHQKKMRTSYKTKKFIFPSGRTEMVQGYEPQALTELLKTYHEDDIITNTLHIPRIKYIGLDNKNHYYFPDIYIPKKNLIVEVKSLYTYSSRVSWLNTNLLKQQASVDAGYDHNFMIMGKK